MHKKIDGCVGRSDGEFDKDISVISTSRKVVIKKSDNGRDRVLDGGIYIPESTEINNRMAKGTVVECSKLAFDEYGLHNGHTVLFDRLAVYYDTNPICVADFENVICIVDDDDKPIALKDMIIVSDMKRKEVSHGGIILSGDNPLDVPIGIVVSTGTHNINCGDYVMLSTGADVVTVGGCKYRIYKEDMVMATIELTDKELDDYEYED